MSDMFDSGVFGQNVPAWHGKGRVVAGTFSFEEALKLGDLDWTTTKVPMRTYGGQFEGIDVPEKFAIVRTDKGTVLGVTGPEYRPISNREAFSFTAQLLADKECRWEANISVDGGRQVAGIISLADSKVEIMRGDAHYLFLTVISSHDGTTALKAFPTDVRVVCANTVRAALNSRNKGLTVNIRHSGDITAKIKAGQNIIAAARKDYAEFTEWQKRIAELEVSKDTYQDLLEELFPSPVPDTDGKVAGRAKTIRQNKVLALTAAVKQEMILLPQFTSTNSMATPMSAYVFLNGVTRYVDHTLAFNKSDGAEYAMIAGGVDVKARGIAAIQKVYSMPA